MPSIRHLEAELTPGEISLWIEKYKNDQFGRYGEDVRNAVRDATLLNAIINIAGGKGKIKANDLLIKFDKGNEEMTTEKMAQRAKDFTAKNKGKIN